jgi:hypothetical protein
MFGDLLARHCAALSVDTEITKCVVPAGNNVPAGEPLLITGGTALGAVVVNVAFADAETFPP